MPEDTTLTAEPSDASSEAAAIDTSATETAATESAAPPTKSKLTPDQMREILRGSDESAPQQKSRDPLEEETFDPLTAFDDGGHRIEQADEPPAEAEPVGEVEAANPVEEQPEVESPDESTTRKTEADGRRRININRKNEDGTFVLSDRTRAVLALIDEEKIDWPEAERRLGFAPLPAEAKAKEEETPSVKAAPVKSSADLAAEIDAKLNEIETAGNDLQPTGTLLRELKQLERDQAAASARESDVARAQETAQQTRARISQESERLAAEQYGESILNNPAKRAGYQDYLNAQNELYDVQSVPGWQHLTLAAYAATQGIAPKLSKSSAAQPAEAARGAKPAAPAAKPAPARRAVPVPSPGGMSGAAVNPAQGLSEQIQAARAARDLPKLKQLMRQADQLASAA